ncbi:putative ATP-utilizing enzyme (ATP-grasp superfamily) [Archaeoglobus sulfaticallidus PM70-1]|uniref:Putative ATP-utilizing enzyme (ATP-grasp superfamily) n=1 Tax=Archaeoglobus sulfaticallidus PM70-1 TaxID=387631 RepID=N0BH89_9EURY|nr:ATP-grasp domain-containing protein [Archaeoglobus sulfaticallidus]AGK61672.1 putative ATP-utilizing enzyme (ATP-grasp superfamily) [Archaeoglobus sulfaticallidus PM70-1]
MDVFLFEYISCGGEAEEDIVVEGLSMFKSLYTGFTKFSNVLSFVNPEYSLSTMYNIPPVRNFEEDFRECCENADYALIIAPEDEGILETLTKIAEKRCENLGSSSKAIAITSSKWLTYLRLKDRVNMPLTSKEPLDVSYVIKPERSCGGAGIDFGSGTVPDGFVAQEFVEGKNLSVSFIVGDEITPLSVNSQLLDHFKYSGALVPANIGKKEEKMVVEEATEAVGCIKGLHGYVGVDVVLSDSPYIIEINARLTTPSIAFEQVYGFNLAELIYKNHAEGHLTFRSKARRVCSISKVNGVRESAMAYHKETSLVVEEVDLSVGRGG